MFSGNQWHEVSREEKESVEHMFLTEEEWVAYQWPDLAFHIRYEGDLAIVYHRMSREG